MVKFIIILLCFPIVFSFKDYYNDSDSDSIFDDFTPIPILPPNVIFESMKKQDKTKVR